MDYYVVLQDYADAGIEGVAHPELTRAQIVSRIKSREFDNIVLIHHVSSGTVTDVTQDLIDEAEAELAEPFGGADEYALPHSVLPPVRGVNK